MHHENGLSAFAHESGSSKEQRNGHAKGQLVKMRHSAMTRIMASRRK